jgi:hypothetical protein
VGSEKSEVVDGDKNIYRYTIMQVELILSAVEIYPKIDMILLHMFCEENNIPIKIRYFDSWKFSRDQKYVQSLPAIHVLHTNTYVTTLYNNPQSLYTIRSLFNTQRHTKKNTFRLFSRINPKLLSRNLLI